MEAKNKIENITEMKSQLFKNSTTGKPLARLIKQKREGSNEIKRN